MKTRRYCELILIGFLLSILVGCADESMPNVDEMGTDSDQQTTSIRYSDEDVTALQPGEFLRLNLTLPNTVYALTYTNPANLDRVLVISDEEKYVLGDRISGTTDDQCTTRRQIVLSGNLGDDGDVEQLEGEPTSCSCPCCLRAGNKLYCCN